MKENSKSGFSLLFIGLLLLVSGLFFIGKAVFSSSRESQALLLPDPITGSQGGVKIMLTYPRRVIIGKTNKITIRFESTGIEDISAVVFDRQLEAPGYVVIPQKRVISPVQNKRETTSWTIVTYQQGKSTCQVLLSLGDTNTSGQFAMTPQAQFEFELTANRFLGLAYKQILLWGIMLSVSGVLIIAANIVLLSKPRHRKF